MRVISGKYKGIVLNGFNIDGTRPTMARVKESVFGSIQNKLKGSVVLDLFAGSGQLGIEALSNGASYSYFVDKSEICVKTIKENLKKINDNNNAVLNMDYKKALLSLKGKIKFDIIFIDPPYNDFLINDALNKIYEYDLLSDDGLIICEYENEDINNENYKIIKKKRYGNKNIIIYN